MREAEIKRELFRLHNEYRRQLGKKPFGHSTSLDKAADWYAGEMASGRAPFSHGNWAQRLKKFIGRRRFEGVSLAENIAYGQDTAQEVMRAWKNSPGHDRNLRDGSLRKIGIGFAKRGETEFWVVDFGTF